RAINVQRDGISVHPASKFTAAQIVRMLRASKNVPDFLKRGLAAKGDAIVKSGKLDKPEGTFSEFLEPFVDALTSDDWQITTADSTTEANRASHGSVKFTQVVTPHLSKRQHLGRSVKTGPGETTFSPDTLFSTEQEVIFGWTVPASSTEQLKTGRGLIVLV